MVQTASPYSPGKYVNWNLSFSMEILYISYENSSRSTVRPYKNLYRSSLVCPLILIRRAAFWCKRLVRTVPGKYVNWNLSFSMEILYISYGNSSRSTVRPYKKLYRSSLVCPLILIRRATFWCKRLVRTFLGSMLTGI